MTGSLEVSSGRVYCHDGFLVLVRGKVSLDVVGHPIRRLESIHVLIDVLVIAAGALSSKFKIAALFVDSFAMCFAE